MKFPPLFHKSFFFFQLKLRCSPKGKRKIRDPFKDKIDSSGTVAVIEHGP